METTAQNIPRMTADEYFKMIPETNQPTELIDGELVSLASPSVRHQDIATGLASELRQFVKQNGGGCKPFAAPMDVKLDDLNVVQPDVFVTCDPNKLTEQHLNGAPDFVAEIVSSNRSDDFDRKLWLYRRSGVREYWIIDPRSERVFAYFFEQDSAPSIYDFRTPIPVQIWDGKLCITISSLETL